MYSYHMNLRNFWTLICNFFSWPTFYNVWQHSLLINVFVAVILSSRTESSIKRRIKHNHPALEIQYCKKHTHYKYDFIIFKAPNQPMLLHIHKSCEWPHVNIVFHMASQPSLTVSTTSLTKGMRQFGYARLV